MRNWFRKHYIVAAVLSIAAALAAIETALVFYSIRGLVLSSESVLFQILLQPIAGFGVCLSARPCGCRNIVSCQTPVGKPAAVWLPIAS
jgi:hypothetical protein